VRRELHSHAARGNEIKDAWLKPAWKKQELCLTACYSRAFKGELTA